LKVIYYTHPSYFDTSLPFIKEISKKVELHVLLEMPPEGWQKSFWNVNPIEINDGVYSAYKLIQSYFPYYIRRYWENTASFSLIIHNNKKSISLASWKTSKKSVKFINKLKPDIIHFDDVSLRMVFVLQYISNSIPIILSIHDPNPHFGEENWRKTYSRKIFYRKTDKIIIHNKIFKKSFCIKNNFEKTSVVSIPLGACTVYKDWTKRLKGKKEKFKKILFFGRISKYKGIEIFYKAIPMISKQIKNMSFIIAGKVRDNYQIPSEPILYNNAKIKIFNEYISNKKVSELFNDSKFVVCPYTDASQSGVILTAYAFGKPVIASNVGALSEYVINEKTGYLIKPNDPNVLALKIIKLLKDTKKQKYMKKNIGKLIKTTLSWEKIANKTIKLYNSYL
jgi:glycosyltransferase involved in cell wall biosynthesis